MAINEDRYERFALDVQHLSRSLNPAETYARARAKLLDLFARSGLDAAEAIRIRPLINATLSEDLNPLVERIIQSYRDTLDIVNIHYNDLGVDLTRDFDLIRAIEETNIAELGTYKQRTIDDIERAFREVATDTGRVRDLEEKLKGVGGKAATFARVIANTQIKTVARVAKAEKARIAEVHFYQYVGIIRETTRPFCEALVGHSFDINTIRAMDNGNRNPVLYYCGGWNCIHDWEPDPFATSGDDARLTVDPQGRPLVLAETVA